MESLESLVKMKKDYQEKIKQDGKAVLRKEMDLFFESLPEVLAIKWTQYTPYFNDGDTCTFGVNEPQAQIEEGEDFRDGYDFTSTWEGRVPSERDNTIRKGLDALYAKFQKVEEVFEEVFGDHSEITVKRNGEVEIEEYEHD